MNSHGLEADAGGNSPPSVVPALVVDLPEFQEVRLHRDQLSDEVGRLIWQRYGKQIAIEAPSFKTVGDWSLTSLGWVGYIPVMPTLGLSLKPKVPLGNIFRMLEYAYRLDSFQILQGLTACGSLAEFYERLASVLARRVLDRARKGFYRCYIPSTDDLPYVRGAIDFRERMTQPWKVLLACDFHDHTADVDENQILAWTLLRIAHSHACTESVLPTVRRAVRSLHGLATTRPCGPEECVRRLYNRLNDDYQPLHALCRFFLEHAGPTIEGDSRAMLPFLVNMGRLFEVFVAEWLKCHLPSQFELRRQECVQIAQDSNLQFRIDMVLFDRSSCRPLAVLDTKYKVSSQPSPDDLSQVVSYAEAIGCDQAFLVYPAELSPPLDVKIGRNRVRSLTFGLGKDVEGAGEVFLRALLA